MTRARSKTAPAPVDTGGPSAGVAFGPLPSTGGRGKYDWVAIAERCKAQPGEWLLVFEGDRRSIAVAVREQSVTTVTADKGFESTTRNNKAKEVPPVCDLYLRYVPANDQSRKRRSRKVK
jgi:hypothetical protein